MNRTSPIRFGMLFAAIAVFVIAIGMYSYLYHDTWKLTEHAIVARTAAAEEGEREKQSKAIRTLASSTAASRARLSGLFVPADDAVAFIQAMESVGESSGATVLISSIGEVQADAAKRKITGQLNAHVSVSGSWNEVMNALELFEVLPYKIRIDRLTLNTSIGSDGGSSGKIWQAAFDISASTLI